MMEGSQADFAFQKTSYLQNLFLILRQIFFWVPKLWFVQNQQLQCCKIDLKYTLAADVEINFFLKSRKLKSKEAKNKTINFFLLFDVIYKHEGTQKKKKTFVFEV